MTLPWGCGRQQESRDGPESPLSRRHGPRQGPVRARASGSRCRAAHFLAPSRTHTRHSAGQQGPLGEGALPRGRREARQRPKKLTQSPTRVKGVLSRKRKMLHKFSKVTLGG